MSKRKVAKKTTPKKNDKIDAVPINLDYELCDAGAAHLAAAIIGQTARDYKYTVKHKPKADREPFRRFFRSQWFEELTIISKVHCDGDKVIELIESGQNETTPKEQLVPSHSKLKQEESWKK